MIGSRRRSRVLAAALVVTVGSLAAVAPWPVSSPSAGADTDPTTLVGQGGSFLEPVMSKLLADDASNIQPLFGSYLLTDDNSGISAFVGSGPGQFTADFTVTQRPLTTTESGQATTDGRTYAYVPFAATPVAVAALVPTAQWELSGDLSITPSGFCQNIPLSTALLGQIFGFDAASPLHSWGDTRITCPEPGGGTTADPFPIVAFANLDPSMANQAMMTLLDSTPASKADFDAALGMTGSLTTDDTPTEFWPFAGNAVPGGDQPLIGKLLDINAQSNAPSAQASSWQLGSITPLSSVWTGAPLGTAWNLPTAAIQNAQGAYVAPSVGAAEAAQADATVASTSDPTTDNLVTFNADTNDATAYNNDLMEESYLVVPTTGLTGAKADALAQVIRFVLGSQGQADIEGFGSAPATPAMQAAGLKVAATLDAEGAASANPAVSGSTSTTTASSTTTTSGANSSKTAATTAAGSTGSGSDPTGSSGAAADSSDGGLAFTGMSHLGDWVALGAALLIVGTILRRRLKRREAS